MSVDLLYKPNFGDYVCAGLKFSDKPSEFFKISSVAVDLALSIFSGSAHLKLVSLELNYCVKIFNFSSFIHSLDDLVGFIGENKPGLLKKSIAAVYYFIDSFNLAVDVFSLNGFKYSILYLNQLKKMIIVSSSVFSFLNSGDRVERKILLMHSLNVDNKDEALAQYNLFADRIRQAKMAAVCSILGMVAISGLGSVFACFSSPVLSVAVGGVYLSANLVKNYYKYNFKKQGKIFTENSIKIINTSVAK